MNLTVLYEYYHDKSGEQQNNVNHFVAASLIHIISHYFVTMANNFVLTITCRREHTSVFYNDMLVKFFADWNEWPIQIVNVQKMYKHQRLQGNRRLNMVLTDSYESFLEADLGSYTEHNNFNEFYYIFLQQRDALLPQEMQQIFEYCWRHYLINCVIQIQNAMGESLIYTYYPFTQNSCNHVNVIVINQFIGTVLMRKELFPKKLKNFYGCALRVATWRVIPYMFVEKDTKGIWDIQGGFEGALLLELSNFMNFSLIVKIPENNEMRGLILLNKTLTGALRMLHNREADFSIGCFRQTSQRSMVATSTINYYQTTFSLVAMEDIYLLTSMETLLYPFSQKLWIILVFIVFFAISLVAIIKKIYRKKLPKNCTKDTMDILLMLVGMPAIYQPKRAVGRLLNVTWMFYALLIRTTYQALLFHMIRTHITIDVPQSLEELPQRDYTMVLNRQGSDVLRSIPALDYIDMLSLNTTSEFAAIEFLESLSLKDAENYVAAMPMDFIKYYIHEKHREGQFRIFPYHLMLFKVCIYMTKHSYLIEQFDEILTWIQGSGLMDCWARQVVDRSYSIAPKDQKDRVFSLSQLRVAFLSLIYLHGLATLIFIIELIHKKVYCRCRKIKK